MSNYFMNQYCTRCERETQHVSLDDTPRRGKSSVRCEECRMLQTSESYQRSIAKLEAVNIAEDPELALLAAIMGGPTELISRGEVS